ncbi:DUF5983 family protein [Serratia ficaria]|uniref:DUF5983 family protein n=1 Tax=Serratia ficaria TaxID=61651 RepID=UPI00093972AD|nr:DUF5983 family protein [Serratia ficaria]
MNKLNIEQIERVAVICTGHVTRTDAELIPCIVWDNQRETGEYWISSTAYGWLFRLNAVCGEWQLILKEEGISDACIENLERLEQEGYDWVHFQADAQIIEGLPHWSW